MLGRTKDNRLHSILKILVRESKDGIKYRHYYVDLIKELSWPWRKYTIYEMKLLCNQLSMDGIVIMHNADYAFMEHDNLLNARKAYFGKVYKEKQAWWIWPARIGGGLIALVGAIGVIDGLQSNSLRNSLNESESTIKSLRQRVAKDSIEIDSLLNLTRKQKATQQADSLLESVKKPN